MKFFFVLFLVLIQLNALGAPCSGASGRYHVNPDGSQGGFIQRTAWVAKETFLDTTSEICDTTIIRGRVRIESGSRIRENVIIEGSSVIQNSHIHGYAKISGRATVQNSEICQASLIEGIKVINSNYYCQTEDPQPKYPGEVGRRTLLGVDSDGDGVRDDIEVFINNELSNTPHKNYAIERTAMKQYAKILQKEILLRQNSPLIEKLKQNKTNLLNCYPSEISNEVFVNMYDNKERLFAMFKVAGHMHGKEIKQPNVNCSSFKFSK